MKISSWYLSKNGCPIIISDKSQVEKLTTDRQTDRRTKLVYKKNLANLEKIQLYQTIGQQAMTFS